MTPRRAPSQKTEPIQDPRCSGTGKVGDDVLLNRGSAFPALCSSCAEENVDILTNSRMMKTYPDRPGEEDCVVADRESS